MSGRGDHHELVAAHVLGALDGTERAELEEHLRGCERCRREVLELAPIPALLARVDVDDVEGSEAPPSPDRLVAAVRDDVARVARSRRRWRWAAVAAAAAVLAIGLLGVTGGDDGRPRFDGTALDVTLAAGGASAEVLADEREWGTYVWVYARDLPRRDAYTLWVVDDEGSWERAGSFAPTADGGTDMGGSSRLPLSSIDRIVVTSDDRSDEILTAR